MEARHGQRNQGDVGRSESIVRDLKTRYLIELTCVKITLIRTQVVGTIFLLPALDSLSHAEITHTSKYPKKISFASHPPRRSYFLPGWVFDPSCPGGSQLKAKTATHFNWGPSPIYRGEITKETERINTIAYQQAKTIRQCQDLGGEEKWMHGPAWIGKNYLQKQGKIIVDDEEVKTTPRTKRTTWTDRQTSMSVPRALIVGNVIRRHQ